MQRTQLSLLFTALISLSAFADELPPPVVLPTVSIVTNREFTVTTPETSTIGTPGFAFRDEDLGGNPDCTFEVESDGQVTIPAGTELSGDLLTEDKNVTGSILSIREASTQVSVDAQFGDNEVWFSAHCVSHGRILPAYGLPSLSELMTYLPKYITIKPDAGGS